MLFFKKKHGKPKYLSTRSHQVRFITVLRILIKLRVVILEQIFFKNYFFPHATISWNKLDIDARKSKSYAIFRNTLLKLRRPNQCTIYSISNHLGFKLLTRLRRGLNHLNEHRFKHNFQNCINSLRSCSLEINFSFFYCTAIIMQTFV